MLEGLGVAETKSSTSKNVRFPQPCTENPKLLRTTHRKHCLYFQGPVDLISACVLKGTRDKLFGNPHPSKPSFPCSCILPSAPLPKVLHVELKPETVNPKPL